MSAMALVWSRSFNTHIITVKDFNHRSHYCNIYILGWGQKSGKLQERCSNEMLATSYSQKWHVTWYAVPASMHAAKCYSANFKDTELWMHTLTCTSQFKISVLSKVFKLFHTAAMESVVVITPSPSQSVLTVTTQVDMKMAIFLPTMWT